MDPCINVEVAGMEITVNLDERGQLSCSGSWDLITYQQVPPLAHSITPTGCRLKDKAQATTDKAARGAVRAAAKAKKEALPQKNTLFNYAVASKVCCSCLALHV